jgi:hypothetical protein
MNTKPMPMVMPRIMAITGIKALNMADAMDNKLERKLLKSRDITT